MTALPPLGFGTFKLTGDDGASAVEMALETGYRHVDTAQFYENEGAVGRGIADADVSRINDIDDRRRLGDPDFAPDW
jgi:2,5-diketo-D-gluconate reductase B